MTYRQHSSVLLCGVWWAGQPASQSVMSQTYFGCAGRYGPVCPSGRLQVVLPVSDCGFSIGCNCASCQQCWGVHATMVPCALQLQDCSCFLVLAGSVCVCALEVLCWCDAALETAFSPSGTQPGDMSVLQPAHPCTLSLTGISCCSYTPCDHQGA